MDFINKYEEVAIKRPNMLLFTADQSLEIIEDCRKEGKKIYGIDGFKIHGKWIQPLVEHSADFSHVQNNSSIFDLAKEFVEQKKTLGLIFEIVL